MDDFKKELIFNLKLGFSHLGDIQNEIKELKNTIEAQNRKLEEFFNAFFEEEVHKENLQKRAKEREDLAVRVAEAKEIFTKMGEIAKGQEAKEQLRKNKAKG
ncbi:MAG: hypothetical protein ACON4W_07070 [Parvibaculales bacterium]